MAIAFVAFLTARPAVYAAPVPGQGTWQTTLQARDLNGDTVTDAFYDTVLNITWLRNANINGGMYRNQAITWAANLTFGGFSDWRLPTMVDTGTPGAFFSATNPGTYAGGTDYGYNVQTSSTTGNVTTVFSEMASLYYDTLGNKGYCPPGSADCNALSGQPGYGLANTGDFIDLRSYFYWTGLEYSPNSLTEWIFSFIDGEQNVVSTGSVPFFAMAVRPGDVTAASVPEPGTFALAAVALVGLGVLRQRRAVAAPNS